VKYAGAVLIAATLFAADRAGPYLGAGMGISSYDDGGYLAAVQNSNVPQYRVSAGAFINENLSVALDYALFDPFDGETDFGGIANEHFQVFSANVYGHYPILNDRLDLYAKFGAGQIFWDETGAQKHSSNAGVLIYGLGVGLRPTPMWTVNLGYDFYSFGMDNNTSSYNMSLGSAYLEFQVQF